MPLKHFEHTFHMPQTILHLNLPQTRNSSLGVVCRCYGNYPPKLSKIAIFAFVPPQTFCAHFSHASNDSHLTSTYTRSSSLELSAVAMVTTPPKSSKIAIFAHLCPPPQAF